jgi:polysaccharide biosynthesis protein PslG
MPLVVRVVLAAALILALAVPAAASAAPPRGFVGMSADDLYGRAGPYRDKALKQQQAAGVQLLRVAFNWSIIEFAPGGRTFASYDRYVLDAARHGITLLPILFNPPPHQSARPAGSKKRGTYPPKDFGAMAAWAVELVDRYGSNGSLWRDNPTVPARPITDWQIWNEPNLGVYWLPRANARQYLRLVQTVGAAIKARDANAKIVTAGLPDSRLGSAIRLAPYLKDLYRGGGSSAFDTVAINSYAVTPKYLGKLMNTTRKLLNGIGGRSDKLWITEVGWCDKGYKPGHRFCVGTKRQTQYTSQALSLIKKKRSAWKLRGFVWFSWRDGRPYSSQDFWGNHTGLLTISGKKKPAFNAFVRGVKRF